MFSDVQSKAVLLYHRCTTGSGFSMADFWDGLDGLQRFKMWQMFIVTVSFRELPTATHPLEIHGETCRPSWLSQ